MDFSIPTVLKSLSSAGAALKEITAWRKQARGDTRSLISEIKDNLTYFDLIVEDEVALSKVINKISMAEYKRLSKSGFNFNSLKRAKISRYASLEGTTLSSWAGKETGDLIDSIYDKINQLKLRYPPGC